MKPDKNRARGIGFYLLIGVIILAVIFYLTTPAEQKEYTYSEIEELFRQEQVKSFCLEGAHAQSLFSGQRRQHDDQKDASEPHLVPRGSW